LAFLPLCRAAASLQVYGYTDQVYYRPGDTGTLKFWIYNSGTVNLILDNVTIIYPWYNPVALWGGNDTIIPSTSVVIAPGGNWSGTSSFTVPNDGRVLTSGSITITGVTDETTRSSSIPISFLNVPIYFSLQNMDQLMTWLTVLVVVIVICTLIIAAAIFLSLRRRQMMWKQEIKPS